MRALAFAALLALTACGPQLGGLEKGETGRVVRAYNGDTLELDSGLRVFLAEIDAPRGEDPYAAQAQGELESLALHRNVQLAYGGTRRWSPRLREGEQPLEAPRENAVAHVFVQSEGGRWFWLQHELVSRGDVFVRPRRDNHKRTPALLALESQARTAERGLWANREYKPLNAARAAELAIESDANCTSGQAPYRLIEGRIGAADVQERRASLVLADSPAEAPFSIVIFGENFRNWDGAPLVSFAGERIRARGALGVFHDQPQLCVDDDLQIEILQN